MVSATDSLSTADFGPGLRVLRRQWVWFAVLGVVLIILGIAAVALSALTTCGVRPPLLVLRGPPSELRIQYPPIN